MLYYALKHYQEGHVMYSVYFTVYGSDVITDSAFSRSLSLCVCMRAWNCIAMLFFR